MSSVQPNFLDWSHYDDITGSFCLDNQWFQCMYTWPYHMSLMAQWSVSYKASIYWLNWEIIKELTTNQGTTDSTCAAEIVLLELVTENRNLDVSKICTVVFRLIPQWEINSFALQFLCCRSNSLQKLHLRSKTLSNLRKPRQTLMKYFDTLFPFNFVVEFAQKTLEIERRLVTCYIAYLTNFTIYVEKYTVDQNTHVHQTLTTLLLLPLKQ